MRAIVTVALLLFAGVGHANDGYITANKLEPSRLPELARVLDEQMREGGRFAFVSAREREQVTSALAEMAEILRDKSSTAELDADARVRLLNAQERANAILTLRDGERLICERRARVGTHHRQTTCETYAERMTRQQGGREAARRLTQPVGCGNGEVMCDDLKGKTPLTPNGF